MRNQTKERDSIRQNWQRKDIKYIQGSQFKLLNRNGHFLLKEYLPKGYYILRFTLKSPEKKGVAKVLIDPNEYADTTSISIKTDKNEAETCIKLPLVIKHASKIKIYPCEKEGLIETTFSILKISSSTCLQLLRESTEDTTNSQSQIQEHPGASATNDTQEIQTRWKRLLRCNGIKIDAAQYPYSLPTVDYEHYIESIEPNTNANINNILRWLKLNPDAPLITVVLVVEATDLDPKQLKESLDSIVNQSYPKWELFIFNEDKATPIVEAITCHYQNKDSRIKALITSDDCEAGQDRNSLTHTKGRFVAMLECYDLLAKDALFWLAQKIQQQPLANLIYSDEDQIDEEGNRKSPYFKPSYNIDLLYSTDYISYLGAYARTYFESTQTLKKELRKTLALRIALSSSPEQIIHIPRVLYHKRIQTNTKSSAQTKTDTASKDRINIVQDHLSKQHQLGQKAATIRQISNETYRCHWHLPEVQPSIELVIIASENSSNLTKTISSILSKTTYINYSITISIAKDAVNPGEKIFEAIKNNIDKVRICRHSRRLNKSTIYNRIAKKSKAEIIGIVSDNIEVISSDWLEEIASHALRADVGCVGPQIIDSKNNIDHRPVIIGLNGIAAQLHIKRSSKEWTYETNLALTQQMSALPGDCLFIQRSIHQEVGGFNEKDLHIKFYDIDFCLRIHANGYRNIYTPYAKINCSLSLQKASFSSAETQEEIKNDTQFMINQYSPSSHGRLPSDLFYNPNLIHGSGDDTTLASAQDVMEAIKDKERIITKKGYYLQ